MDLGQFGTEFLYSAVIAVIFAVSGRIWSRLIHRNAAGLASMQMGQVMAGGAHPQGYPQAAKPTVNYGRVLMHVGIFQLIVNVVAFIIGFAIGLALVSSGQSVDSQSSQLLVALVTFVFGTIALLIGFLVIGLRVERATRWVHLTYVALGIVVTTLLINWLVGVLRPTSVAALVAAVIFALAQTFIGMGIGGGLSFLIGGRQSATQPYQPGMPYGYPAPPSAPFYPGQPVGPSRPLYPPPPGPQPYPPQYPPQQPQPYPPQQGAPHYPPVQPPTPQYPGYPQYPPAQPPTPQYPQYPPQQPPQYPPQQQPPAGGGASTGDQ